MTRQQHVTVRGYVEQLRISLGVRDVAPERAEEFGREIEAHLQASGEDAEETFGKPWELAEALVAARPSPRAKRDPLGFGALAFAAFVGPWLVFHGVTAVATGEAMALTLAHIASLAVGLVVLSALLPIAFAYFDGRRSLWSAVGVFTAAIAVVVGVYLAVPGEVLYEGSGWQLIALGVLALIANAGLIIQRSRQRPDLAAATRPERAERAITPVQGSRAHPVRRVLDTEILADVSAGSRTVAIVAVIVGGLLGGGVLADRGPDLPISLALLWGLLLGGLIGDAWGARRVRRQYDDAADQNVRVD